ncbi:hypothetical protein KP509_25G062300 [Ceratopteris richardii]|uniref:CS domain-containing protein n=1 Tax=Ceratopteris richardii TaxID=49495 RepID=A0A8T2RQV8_CERRI|nr:hypothetical protein KP509_25G062300 [Ceratopteris richardii]KAH7298870.1 hypothetical protein KP509_25G062300 [Ceratopteris richardii]KAH7298871.1 hypothetical protein KP509_25G062300 [Ceratopteris richardii]KAH7298872.1 hypothetical protein KP509_25G062300 [Ceratopteris richardii]
MMEKVRVMAASPSSDTWKEHVFKPHVARKDVLEILEKLHGIGELKDAEGFTVADSELGPGEYKYTVSLDALDEANKALQRNPSSPEAYYRKGVALFQLEEYETAKTAFTTGMKLDPKNPEFEIWIKKCTDAIAAESQSDVAEVPRSKDQDIPCTSKTQIATDSPPPSQPTPVQKFRQTFYQSSHEAVVEILAKGLKAEQVKVEFGIQSLKVQIDVPYNEPYAFQTRLYGKVYDLFCRSSLFNNEMETSLGK